MNKKLLTFVLSLMTLGASAQQVTSGIVTDKAGNPISGARVEAKGTKYYTMTGIDGRFSLETPTVVKKVNVSSVGCATQKKIEVTPNMSVVMLPENAWGRKPTKWKPLVTVQATIPGPHSKDVPLGAMVGIVKSVGFYGRAVFSSMPGSVGTIESVPESTYYFTNNNYLLKSTYKTGYQAFTGGFIFRLGAPVYLTLGGGCYKREVAVEHYNGGFLKVGKDSGKGAAAELGLMLKFGHVLVTGGATTWIGQNENDSDHSCVAANFGIGYIF